MMLVSMVGQASFHTAGSSGPSTMDLSYRRRSPLPACAAAGGGTVTGGALVVAAGDAGAPSSLPWPVPVARLVTAAI